MSSSYWDWVSVEVEGTVDFAGVEEVGVVAEGAETVVEGFCFVGVVALESSFSESESESQVRSSSVDCAAPVLRFVSNLCRPSES